MAKYTKLMTDVTTNTTSSWVAIAPRPFTICAGVTGTGIVSVMVTISLTHDKSTVYTQTISLSGTTSDVDIATFTGYWNHVRVATSSIAGTNATVNVTMANELDMY